MWKPPNERAAALDAFNTEATETANCGVGALNEAAVLNFESEQDHAANKAYEEVIEIHCVLQPAKRYCFPPL